MSKQSSLIFALLAAGACSGGPPASPERNPHLRIGHAPPPDARDFSSATGSLDDAAVRAVMEEQQAGFLNCFEQVGASYLSGDVQLNFVVKNNGRVEHVWVGKSDLGSVRIEDCLVQTARYLEFPPPAGDKRARFAYPVRINEPGARLTSTMDAAWGYATLVRQRAQIVECRKAHGFDAPFQATLYVGRKGQVLSAGFDSPEPPGTDMPACVAQVAEGVRFPDPGNRIVKFQALIEDLPDALTPMNQ